MGDLSGVTCSVDSDATSASPAVCRCASGMTALATRAGRTAGAIGRAMGTATAANSDFARASSTRWCVCSSSSPLATRSLSKSRAALRPSTRPLANPQCRQGYFSTMAPHLMQRTLDWPEPPRKSRAKSTQMPCPTSVTTHRNSAITKIISKRSLPYAHPTTFAEQKQYEVAYAGVIDAATTLQRARTKE